MILIDLIYQFHPKQDTEGLRRVLKEHTDAERAKEFIKYPFGIVWSVVRGGYLGGFVGGCVGFFMKDVSMMDGIIEGSLLGINLDLIQYATRGTYYIIRVGMIRK